MNRITEDYRRVVALNAFASGERVTQRTLAAELELSLGRANAFLRQLQREGFVAVSRSDSARALDYALTPAGVREMKRAAAAVGLEAGDLLYGLRTELEASLRALNSGRGKKSVVLCGEGALADVAASVVLNSGMKLAGVVARDPEGEMIAGHRARPVKDVAAAKPDVVVAVTAGDAQSARRRVGKKVPVVQFLPRGAEGENGRG